MNLDETDEDYGSGGLMLLPDQPGPVPHVAAAAGKDGRLFILNRDHMGGFHNPDTPNHVDIGECFCGLSYYTGADGRGRVVTSGGTTVKTWIIDGTASPSLTQEASADIPDTFQDGGFFTTISSDGTKPGTTIIWAVARPDD